MQLSSHGPTEAFATEHAQECAPATCVLNVLWRMKDRVSKRDSTSIWSSRRKKNVQALHVYKWLCMVPAMSFSHYCSSEELWLLLFVRKYRKIEFHKNMHFPPEENKWATVKPCRQTERQACVLRWPFGTVNANVPPVCVNVNQVGCNGD